MQKYLGLFIVLLTFSLLNLSCRKTDERTAEQKERDEIMAHEDLLRNNLWSFNDLKVTVSYEARAIPLLTNVADENGYVQRGTYDSYDIFGNGTRQQKYTYQFLRDEIRVDTHNQTDFNRLGGYFLINTTEMRVNLDSLNAIRFTYKYDPATYQFMMISEAARNERFNDAVNDLIRRSILSGKPGDLADVFVDFLINNDQVKKAITQLLYELLHGKVTEITQSPEETAYKIAEIIFDKLQEQDWDSIVYERVLELLESLQVENPEETAQELSERIAEKVEASISEEGIYDRVYPILLRIETESLPLLATRIANEVYSYITDIFTFDRIYDRIYPLWTALAVADSTTVNSTADTLATIVADHFFSVDSLKIKLEPFIQRVDETIRLGDLAWEIVDSVLIPAVDEINDRFPGAGLEPEWEQVQQYLTGVLTIIKAALNSSTVEELTETLATSVNYIMQSTLQSGFSKALFKMQTIPPDQASTYIASWVTNLVEMAEEEIVTFIENKLNEILSRFDAEAIAQELSLLIYNKVLEVLNEEKLYELILPLLEQINALDMEAIASTITEWLFENGAVGDNVSKEDVVEALAQIIIQVIEQAEPDTVTELLVNLILDSDFVGNIDGVLLSKLIEIKIYELLLHISKSVNAISLIELSIQIK